MVNPHQLIRDRLRSILADRSITAVELARDAGVKTSFLYDILNGKSTNPSTVKLGQVARALNVELAYLSGMSGSAITSSTTPDPDDYACIPCLNAADKESDYYRFRHSWIRNHLQATPEQLRSLHVRGDSMAPTLLDGDVLLVDLTRNKPSPPGIFVLDDGVGLVVKRLELTGTEPMNLRILSDNTNYSAYERTIRDASIVGRVIWFSRKL